MGNFGSKPQTSSSEESERQKHQQELAAELRRLEIQQQVADKQFEGEEKRKQLAWQAAQQREHEEWNIKLKRVAAEKDVDEKAKYCDELRKLRGPMDALTKHLTAVVTNPNDKTMRSNLLKAIDPLLEKIEAFVSTEDVKIWDITEILQIKDHLVTFKIQLNDKIEVDDLDPAERAALAQKTMRNLSLIEGFVVVIENRNAGSFELSREELIARRKKNLDLYLRSIWLNSNEKKEAANDEQADRRSEDGAAHRTTTLMEHQPSFNQNMRKFSE